MLRNRIKIILLAMIFSFACVLPAVGNTVGSNDENTQEVVATILPTMISTSNPLSDCEKNIEKEFSEGVVDAKPVGLYLRKTPNGEVLAIIPDGESVEILTFDSGDGWAVVRWRNVANKDANTESLCGYAFNKWINFK